VIVLAVGVLDQFDIPSHSVKQNKNMHAEHKSDHGPLQSYYCGGSLSIRHPSQTNQIIIPFNVLALLIGHVRMCISFLQQL
jgi:hypothetical protein